LARERARERQVRAEAEARERAAAHERELREKEEARARLLAEERQAREQAAREAAEAEARAKDLALEQERQRLVQEEAQAAEREAVVFSESTRSARHRAQGRKRGQDRGQSPETSLALSGDQDRVAAKGRSALSSRKGDPKPDRANERPIIDVQSSDEKSAGKKGKHVVQPGETLWAVARKHAVDVGQLAEWNKFSARTEVKTGQVLVIWSKDAAKKLPAVNSVSRPLQSSSKYTVREGDTLFSISRRFKVSMAELRKWNGSDVAKQVQVGRNIKVQMAKD
jgi:membrane-bound lytic murein transglycosylase D